MEHCGVCIILLSVGVKYLYANIKKDKRYVAVKRDEHLLQSLMPGFMSRREDWIVVCPIRLAIIAILVSLFSCVQTEHQDSKTAHGLTMTLKFDDFYKSIVFSVFILFSIHLQTPLLMGPWLNFTLKNFLLTELPSLGRYINDLPHQNIVSTIMFYTLAAYIVVMQIHWWSVICNYHNFLWVEIIKLLPSKSIDFDPRLVSEEMDNDEYKNNAVIR